MQRNLTKGPITIQILLFALPLMLGNLLQQMYNIADTWVVGQFLGADALAAVGSSYTLMTSSDFVWEAGLQFPCSMEAVIIRRSGKAFSCPLL